MRQHPLGDFAREQIAGAAVEAALGHTIAFAIEHRPTRRASMVKWTITGGAGAVGGTPAVGGCRPARGRPASGVAGARALCSGRAWLCGAVAAATARDDEAAHRALIRLGFVAAS